MRVTPGRHRAVAETTQPDRFHPVELLTPLHHPWRSCVTHNVSHEGAHVQDQAWRQSMVSNGGAITDDLAYSSYQEKKEAEVCTYPGCAEPPDARPGKESAECEEHHERSKARQRRAKRARSRARQALRKIWRKKKLCKLCGDKRVPKQKHCAKCLVAIGGVSSAAVNKQVNKKAARIEANTSVDRDGRSRYRGQGKRGRQSVAAIDSTDLTYAADALKRGTDGLAYSSSTAVAQLPRIQREDLKRASLGEVLLARRFLDDVLARHRVIAPTVVEDED